MSMVKSMEVAGDGKIGRNQSRLRMHAPSSIQVVPTSGSVAEWKVAIPLLSPLDIVSIPLTEDLRGNELAVKAGKEEEASSGGSEGRGVPGRWRHPAEPFYYEPAPAFTVPHCT